MNRRDAVFALIALGASPVTCFAQQAGRTFRIGFIAISDSFTSGSPNAFAWLALESRLRELGYREGENLVIERHHASGDPSRLKYAASNRRKHKVTFDEAVSVFYDPLSATFPDPDSPSTEQRLVTVGQSWQGRLLVVVHTEQDETIRLISARLATAHERKRHEG